MSRSTLPSWNDSVRFYDHITLHLVPGPRSASYFVPSLLIVASLVTPPRLLPRQAVHLIVLPSLYAFQLYVWIQHNSFDVISVNAALSAFMLLGWYDVRQDFQHVRRIGSDIVDLNDMNANTHDRPITSTGKNTHDQIQPPTTSEQPYVLEPYPETFFARLKWTILLFSSMRLTDWHIGIPSHDLQQPSTIKPFSEFIYETLTQGAIAYVLLVLTMPYMAAISCDSRSAFSAAIDFRTQVVRSLVLLAYFYASLSLFTALLPHLMSIGALIIAPTLRHNSLVSPMTWPGHFGPLSSIYSLSPLSRSRNLGLRAFWGTFWHQNMRYVTSTPGIALAALLGLSKGSKLRYMIIVASGFFWSGVVHMGVIPPNPIDTSLGAWSMRIRIASFFWLQVVGIAVEDLVQSCFQTGESSRVNHPMGPEPTDRGTAVTDDKSQDTQTRATSFVIKCGIVLWTLGFLASTAWLTVLPVGCQMGWWNLRLLPVDYLGFSLLS